MNVDLVWARKQLDDAGYRTGTDRSGAIRDAVELLLVELTHQELSVADQSVVLELFDKLAHKQELVGRETQRPDTTWAPFQLGDVDIGATVRVRAGGYVDKAGDFHNGRIGHLVAARGGYAVVQYAGEADTTGHRHPPAVLEVLVKR